MNETYVTFMGWLGNDVETREVGDATVATFRVGSTPRRYNPTQRTWADGDTTWYTVNAWRGLGEHCLASLKRRDPVVVHGKQSVQVWKDTDGHERQTLVVEAISVGHDLSKGTSTFTKAVRASRPTTPRCASSTRRSGSVGRRSAAWTGRRSTSRTPGEDGGRQEPAA